MVQLVKLCEQDETTSDSIALLEAEFAFAEKSFLELSRQATAFQDCARPLHYSKCLLSNTTNFSVR